MPKRIPVEIEIIGTHFQKSVVWSAVGYSVGSLIAGPVGGLIGGLSQGNGKNFQCVVKFDDGSQKFIKCSYNQLNLELVIWSWRINHKKSEQDYVDFGLDFSTFIRGMLITHKTINQCLGLENVDRQTSFGELWQALKLELALKKFFKKEIERYFREQRNDYLVLENDTNGLKIPSKISENLMTAFVVIFFIFIGSCAFFYPQKPAPEYNTQPTSNEY